MSFEVTEELRVAIKNEAGALAAALRAVADAKVEVRAFCAYGMGPDSAFAHIVPADAAKAKKALKKAGYEVTSGEVVVATVSDKRGKAADLASQAAEKGINLDYAYATGVGKGKGVLVLAADKSVKKLAKALEK